MWLLRRDLKLNHEFLADQAVLNKGIDAQKYQLLVLQKAVGERRFALANHFSQKPILKRIKMMKKNKKRWTQIKLLLFVPILLLLLQAFARPELISSPEEFVPLKYQKNATETWLDNWNVENFKNLVTSERRESYKKDPKTGKVVELLAFSDVVTFKIDSNNNITIGKDKEIQKADVKNLALDFLQGNHPTNKSDPDYFTKEFPFVGIVRISKAELFVKHDPNSSIEIINATLRNIGEAYLEIRQKKAKEFFGVDYFSLDNEKQKMIDEIFLFVFHYCLQQFRNCNNIHDIIIQELILDDDILLKKLEIRIGKSYSKFINLAFFLEELLGRKVDLLTDKSLSPHLGHYILNETEYVPL